MMHRSSVIVLTINLPPKPIIKIPELALPRRKQSLREALTSSLLLVLKN